MHNAALQASSPGPVVQVLIKKAEEHPPLLPIFSTGTPLTLKQKILQDHYALANPMVTQWVESYVGQRANNVNKLLVVVGDRIGRTESESVTMYLLLHQEGRVNMVMLSQEDYHTLLTYLADPHAADASLMIAAYGVRAKLDRVSNQLANYRTFYALLARIASIAVVAYSILDLMAEMGAGMEELQQRVPSPAEREATFEEKLLGLHWKRFGLRFLALCGGGLLLSRYWKYQDDAAISDDIEVLEGFKAHLQTLKKDAYSSRLIRFFFSDWSTPSPESRLANVQARIDALKQKERYRQATA